MQIPFLCHGLLALPGSFNFIRLALRTPKGAQLPLPDTSLNLRPILVSYSLLLLSTSAVSIVLGCGLVEQQISPLANSLVAVGMGIYHVGPILRAWTRLRDKKDHGKDLGGAGVHLIVHLAVLLGLATTAFRRN